MFLFKFLTLACPQFKIQNLKLKILSMAIHQKIGHFKRFLSIFSRFGQILEHFLIKGIEKILFCGIIGA